MTKRPSQARRLAPAKFIGIQDGFGLCPSIELYNLTARTLELEVLPAAQHYGLGVIAWSPLASGWLAGPDEEGGVRRLRPRRGSDTPQAREQVARWESFCAERGLEPGQAALAWILHQPGVLGPIVGPRTVAQLDSALDVLSMTHPG
jgi:aryl-alcohol dehydrogenase-like predicted oxidoreductase